MFLLISNCPPLNGNIRIHLCKKDIQLLHKRVVKLYEQSRCFSKVSTSFFDIHYCSRSESFELKDLYNIDSVETLKPTKFKYKMGRRLLRGETFILDSKSNVLATSNGLQVYCMGDSSLGYSRNQTIVDTALAYGLKPLIALDGVPVGTYFGFATNGEVYVFDLSSHKSSFLTLNEYIEKNEN